MELDTRVRELFFKHTKEPTSFADVCRKINVPKKRLHQIIRAIRKEGSTIWTINTGTVWLVQTKEVVKRKDNTKQSIVALLKNDYYSVTELSILLNREYSSIFKQVKNIRKNFPMNSYRVGNTTMFKIK